MFIDAGDLSGFSIYTKLIAIEALRRNIQIFKLANNINFAKLVFGDHTEYIDQSRTNKTGSVCSQLLSDKSVYCEILDGDGFPVPKSVITNSISELAEFLNKYKRIVIKPKDSSQGKGVTADIQDSVDLEKAYKYAMSFTKDKNLSVVAQEYIVGDDHRILIVNKKDIFGIKRVPAHVVGDGKSTIEELINIWNASLEFVNRQIKITDNTKTLLSEQKKELSTVLDLGEKVSLSKLANSHQGGISYDITEVLSSDVKKMVIEIASKYDIGLVGIDIISTDISKECGKIIELNLGAGVLIHHHPTIGKSRNVAKSIVDMLFPETIQ